MNKLMQRIKDFFTGTIRIQCNELQWLEHHLCDNCIEPFTPKTKRNASCIKMCKPLFILRQKYPTLTQLEKDKILQGLYKEVLKDETTR